jgi:hypothetical protein
LVAGLTGDFLIVLVVRAELQESFVQGVPGAQSQLGNQLSNKDTELRFIAGLSHARWVAMFLLKCFFPIQSLMPVAKRWGAPKRQVACKP